MVGGSEKGGPEYQVGGPELRDLWIRDEFFLGSLRPGGGKNTTVVFKISDL